MLLGALPALFTPSMFVSRANSFKTVGNPGDRDFEGFPVFSPTGATDDILGNSLLQTQISAFAALGLDDKRIGLVNAKHSQMSAMLM